jgi:hypothetical protein
MPPAYQPAVEKIVWQMGVFKNRRNPFIPFEKVVQLVENPYDDEGTCTFYIARRQA